MSTSDEMPEPTAEVQRQLDQARSQMALYARDLKRLVEAERQKTQALTAAYQQLQSFAHDLKATCTAERHKNLELEKVDYDIVMRLFRIARARESGNHLQRMGLYARVLAQHIGLPEAEVEMIADAALLHDIGKLEVPESVLYKEGRLNTEQRELVKRHTILGASLLQGAASPLMEMAQQIALTHHEHWDGSGYPKQLKGEAIPLAGRIVHLADQYDVLRSRRLHTTAVFDHSSASDTILRGGWNTFPEHYDPRLLQAFCEVHREFEAIYKSSPD